VNGKNITKQDAEQFVAAAQPNAHFAQLDKAQKEMIKQRLVEKVLFTELAKKEGVENDAEFKAAIDRIKEELLVNIWMKKQLDNTLVSDSEAKEFYEKNKAKFKQPTLFHIRHILVKTEKEASDILKELEGKKGNDYHLKFIELAKTKSVGPTKVRGGDLGSLSETDIKGKLDPGFSKALLSLKSKESTKKPVKSQFGYHIIYLEEKKEAQTRTFEQSKDEIIVYLKQKQFTVKIAEVAKELKSKAKIVDTATETETK